MSNEIVMSMSMWCLCLAFVFSGVLSDQLIPLVDRIALVIFFASSQLVEDESDDSKDKEEGCEGTH